MAETSQTIRPAVERGVSGGDAVVAALRRREVPVRPQHERTRAFPSKVL